MSDAQKEVLALAEDAPFHGPAGQDDGLVKVMFDLDVDEDGWPPYGAESVWAEPLGQERYRLANTPWFARGFALDDVVVASPDEQQVLWVQECEQPSRRLTARVIPLPEGPLAGSCGAVLEVFTPLGIGAETAEPAFPIVALDIPADSDLAAIKGLLLAGRQDGRWDFEEGAVSEGWMAL